VGGWWAPGCRAVHVFPPVENLRRKRPGPTGRARKAVAGLTAGPTPYCCSVNGSPKVLGRGGEPPHRGPRNTGTPPPTHPPSPSGGRARAQWGGVHTRVQAQRAPGCPRTPRQPPRGLVGRDGRLCGRVPGCPRTPCRPPSGGARAGRDGPPVRACVRGPSLTP
jgi:hypothetical protein